MFWGGADVAKHTIAVELWYAGAWHAAPGYDRDPVTVTRGRGDGQGRPSPSTAVATLDNRTQQFNPRDPRGALFGLIGRNTPARILIDGQIRGRGEVSSWKPRETPGYNPATGRGDAWNEIEMSGILRRLGQGDPLISAARRAILDTGPTAYWPLEDGEHATAAASAVAGVADMAPLGQSRFTTPSGSPIGPAGLPRFSVGPGPAGSLPLASIADGGMLAASIPLRDTGSWQVDWTMTLDAGSASPTGSTEPMWWRASGSLDLWTVLCGANGIYVYVDSEGVPVGRAYSTQNVFDGAAHHYSFWVRQDGPYIEGQLLIDGVAVATMADVADPGVVVDGTIGGITSMWINPIEERGDNWPTAIGHLAYWSPYISTAQSLALVEAVHGHRGEPAGVRLARVCVESGVTLTLSGDATATTPMGPQRPVGLLDHLAECEAADGGILYEPRDAGRIAYRTRASLYNQTPALTLDYQAEQVAPPLDPVVDDLDVTNDVTVTTSDGATARAVAETGPLSVQPPPAGVGRYDTRKDVNATSSVLPDLAGWALHLGTWDETRYPRVTVDLDATPDLTAAATAVDIGDVIQLDGVAPDSARLLVRGYTETVSNTRRTITYVTTPAGPWTVAVRDTARRDTAGTVLADAVTASDTSWTVVTASGPIWTTDPADMPLDVVVGGERVTVTDIAGTGTAQTMTVTRSVNGVSKPHSANAPVRLWQPAVRAL